MRLWKRQPAWRRRVAALLQQCSLSILTRKAHSKRASSSTSKKSRSSPPRVSDCLMTARKASRFLLARRLLWSRRPLSRRSPAVSANGSRGEICHAADLSKRGRWAEPQQRLSRLWPLGLRLNGKQVAPNARWHPSGKAPRTCSLRKPQMLKRSLASRPSLAPSGSTSALPSITNLLSVRLRM